MTRRRSRATSITELARAKAGGCARPCRHFLASASAFLLLGTVAQAQADRTRPNVLFIIADDLRVEPDPSQVFTPSLDRLARKSLQFARAYCQVAVFSQFPRRVPGGTAMGYSVRTDRYRYTEWQDSSAELYDLANDPFNNVNLAAQPEHRKTVKELSSLLRTSKAFGNAGQHTRE